MSNISITRRCNRQCTYCFALAERASGGPDDMPRDIFRHSLDFIRQSGVPQARLMGGEPTIHPHFREYVEMALDGGFHVAIFTGGLVPEPVCDFLAEVPVDRIVVVLNIAAFGEDREDIAAYQEELCRRLSGRVLPGVNICGAADIPPYVIDWIDDYHLQRRVRLGLAHPIYGHGNSFMRWQQRQAVGKNTERFLMQAQDRGIAADFDCGWTPCMFSAEFLENYASWRDSIGNRCSPVVDILPEGDTIPCYALSKAFRLPHGSGNRAEVMERFDGMRKEYRISGAGRECGACGYRESGLCTGGCLSRAMARIRNAGGGNPLDGNG
ncbi:MAG: hypothetical protein C0404_05320 [Verrucomicrobia bacterium]|nr:hypothetical protein [Verrucomicrobiota bacterium]